MKVSIIVPVFGTESYIYDCLKSLVSQTYENIEIVVVNDATKDNAMKIVDQFAMTDKRIIVVNKVANEGSMKARESGIVVSTGDYIMFCDSDDSMPLSAVDSLLKAIVESNSDVVIGDFFIIKGCGHKQRKNNVLKYGKGSDAIYKSFIKGECTHSLWGKIYKSYLFKNNHIEYYINSTNSEDMMMNYQVVYYCQKIAKLDVPVYNYFLHNENSATQSEFSEEKLEQLLSSTDWMIRFMNNNKINVDKKVVCQRVVNRVAIYLRLGGTAKSINEKHDAIGDFILENPFRSIMLINLYLLLKYKKYTKIYQNYFKIKKHINYVCEKFKTTCQ